MTLSNKDNELVLGRQVSVAWVYWTWGALQEAWAQQLWGMRAGSTSA